MILGNGRGGAHSLNSFFSWLKNRSRINQHYARNNPFKVASKETIDKLENDLKNYKKQMFGGRKPHKKLKLLFQ